MAQRYDSVEGGISDFFAEVFGKDPIKVLDVGCGSGRDLKRLQDLGHEVCGVDACKEFLKLAHENHQIEENRLLEASLPDLDVDFTGKFDGVLCSAVLMHLPPDDFPKLWIECWIFSTQWGHSFSPIPQLALALMKRTGMTEAVILPPYPNRSSPY